MGNQGTKHWKFSAFFVVSLMLIAGLFSNAAMAAPDDGEGTVAVQWQAATVTTDAGDGTKTEVAAVDASLNLGTDPAPRCQWEKYAGICIHPSRKHQHGWRAASDCDPD